VSSRASARLRSRPAAVTFAAHNTHPPARLSPTTTTSYGWNNIGFHASSQPNAKEIQTPNMDALAAQGVILDRHYVYRFCSPSRSSFQTGRNPIHVNTGNDGLTLVNPKDPVSGFAGIPRNMTVLAEKLAAAGYATAQAGKWRVRAGAGIGATSRDAPRLTLSHSLSLSHTHSLSSSPPRCSLFIPAPLPLRVTPCPHARRHCGLATPTHTPMGRGYQQSLTYLDGAND
jgi:hypothetical protein